MPNDVINNVQAAELIYTAQVKGDNNEEHYYKFQDEEITQVGNIIVTQQLSSPNIFTHIDYDPKLNSAEQANLDQNSATGVIFIEGTPGSQDYIPNSKGYLKYSKNLANNQEGFYLGFSYGDDSERINNTIFEDIELPYSDNPLIQTKSTSLEKYIRDQLESMPLDDLENVSNTATVGRTAVIYVDNNQEEKEENNGLSSDKPLHSLDRAFKLCNHKPLDQNGKSTSMVKIHLAASNMPYVTEMKNFCDNINIIGPALSSDGNPQATIKFTNEDGNGVRFYSCCPDISNVRIETVRQRNISFEGCSVTLNNVEFYECAVGFIGCTLNTKIKLTDVIVPYGISPSGPNSAYIPIEGDQLKDWSFDLYEIEWGKWEAATTTPIITQTYDKLQNSPNFIDSLTSKGFITARASTGRIKFCGATVKNNFPLLYIYDNSEISLFKDSFTNGTFQLNNTFLKLDTDGEGNYDDTASERHWYYTYQQFTALKAPLISISYSNLKTNMAFYNSSGPVNFLAGSGYDTNTLIFSQNSEISHTPANDSSLDINYRGADHYAHYAGKPTADTTTKRGNLNLSRRTYTWDWPAAGNANTMSIKAGFIRDINLSSHTDFTPNTTICSVSLNDKVKANVGTQNETTGALAGFLNVFYSEITEKDGNYTVALKIKNLSSENIQFTAASPLQINITVIG